MQNNPLEAWQRLSDLYREMGDEELRELDENLGDLTEVAQQVLRDEMRKRRLDEPHAAENVEENAGHREDLESGPAVRAPEAADAIADSDLGHEYTWKTLLCECDNHAKAWQISETLKRAGIESWLEGPQSTFQFDGNSPRVLVAADQLEQARGIAARPIPQEIIDQSEADVPEFELPVCPRCGAADPALESVDPVNTWRCETCQKLWTDPAGDMKEENAEA
ncbi:MAG: hypothetical protein WAM85_21530 [Terracidiphilus sp.]